MSRKQDEDNLQYWYNSLEEGFKEIEASDVFESLADWQIDDLALILQTAARFEFEEDDDDDYSED